MAGPISANCLNQIQSGGHNDDLLFAAQWILIREYKRITSPKDVPAWDATVNSAWNSGNPMTLDPGPQATQFSNQVGQMMTNANAFPGWNDTACTMDWGTYAAFANWAAKLSPSDLAAAVSNAKPGVALPYTVDPSIKADPAYAFAWPSPSPQGVVYGGPLPTPGSQVVKYGGPFPIGTVLGVGAVVLIGGGLLYAMSRKSKSPALNPRHDAVYREYIENAAWKRSAASSRTEHEGERCILILNPTSGRREMTPMCEISVEDLEHTAGLRRRGR